MTLYSYHIIYIQALQKTTGTETLARTWPTTLPYMSGNERHLELEMLIGLDNLSHSFQKLLNVNNIDHSPKLKYVKYHAETERLEVRDSDSNEVPPTLSRAPPRGVEPMYHQEILHAMSSTDEEYRKYYHNNNTIVYTHLIYIYRL